MSVNYINRLKVKTESVGPLKVMVKEILEVGEEKIL